MKLPTIAIAGAVLLAACHSLDRHEPEQTPAEAEVAAEAGEQPELVSQPLIVPLVSADPKVAASAGLMVGYAHQFDAQSPRSIFAAMGSYSTSDSYFYGAFADSYFHEDTTGSRPS